MLRALLLRVPASVGPDPPRRRRGARGRLAPATRAAAALRRARPPRARRATRSPPSAPPPTPTSGAPSSPEALHVTLAFLGSRPPDDVDADRADRRRRAAPAPRSSRSATSCCSRRAAPASSPSTLDDPTGALAALQARVSAALAAAGVYTPEKRPFRAARHGRPPAAARPPAARRRRSTSSRSPFSGTARHALRLPPASRRRPLRGARTAPLATLTATLSRPWSSPRPGGPFSPRCSPSPRSWPSRTPPRAALQLALVRRLPRRACATLDRPARPRGRRSRHGRPARSRRAGKPVRPDADVPVRRPRRRGRERDAERRQLACPQLEDRFRLIGYDQRGTGPLRPAALPAARDATRTCATPRRREDCANRLGVARHHYTTRGLGRGHGGDPRRSSASRS